MPGCLHETLSALWIGITNKWRLGHDERALEAEDQLQRQLVTLDKKIATLDEQQDLALSEARVNKVKNRTRCKQKFIEYKRIEQQRDRLNTYRDMVMTHIDALNNTELNKALISTLQESAKTLKAMGVVDGIRQAELVVQDVESSMAQAQELTQVLGQPLHMDYNAVDWDTELEEMLKEDEPMPVAVMVPDTKFSIHSEEKNYRTAERRPGIELSS